MKTQAIVLERPQHLVLRELSLAELQEDDVLVDVEWSGISTGTERLLWSGQMPTFPGMGYPLVPGYESVGRIRAAGPKSGHGIGERVFVPGARCFGDVRGLFGASASTLVVPGAKAYPIGDALGEQAVLLALAATAYHAVAGGGTRRPVNPPDLIVGHGVLGRLLARLTVIADFPAPTVWETSPLRAAGAAGYPVLHPDEDRRRDYRHVYDVSGDSTILDRLVSRLAPGGEIVLAGFYSQPLSFAFAPAFMREAQIRVAAEWKRADMLAVREIADAGLLPLSDLITHHAAAGDCERAYRTAFEDSQCLKMVINWTGHA
ncbi:MAG: chlorophyll synthesis pathway protein BchC [Pseudomonadota bacterium]|jgi:3-hydroxyethyl bacteriochlorophyllide a dehydrogenase|nr:chlorophyll synthesis pathway protein BchC [Rubrivivax sp.]MCA3258652.1 chlorophyll synthesis pathway protein BchC [Rubrivivax sp.]MCZ8030227.1 chlorophyll synthesis pathway protein BchC [Rubrivivax sp.]